MIAKCHGKKLIHKFRDTDVPIPLECPVENRENIVATNKKAYASAAPHRDA